MAGRRASLLISLALFACTEGSPPASPPHHAVPHATEAPATTTVAVAPEAVPSRDVTFVTSDGVTIAGTLERAPRVDAPAVILVHQVGSTRAEWAPLLPHLHADAAFTTLAIDLRGHGASTHGPSGTLDFERFDDAAWAATRLDVIAAVAFLLGPDSGVAPPSVGAVGSSIGSSAVIAAAADDPRITTIVTLSPGRAYHGFDAITPAIQLEDRSIFAIASRDEADSVDTARAYGRITAVQPLVLEGDAHGVVMFGTEPTTLGRIEDFLRSRLVWPRLVPRDEAPSAPPPATSVGTTDPTH